MKEIDKNILFEVSQPPHLKRQGHAKLGNDVSSFSHKTDLWYYAHIKSNLNNTSQL